MLVDCGAMREKMPFIEEYDVVLHRLGGSELLLERLLSKFLDSYRDAAGQLSALLAGGKRDEAHRLVHSIKGVSSNLGLAGIYRASTDLDVLLKGEPGGADEPRKIESFTRELASVIACLDSFAGSPGR